MTFGDSCLLAFVTTPVCANPADCAHKSRPAWAVCQLVVCGTSYELHQLDWTKLSSSLSRMGHSVAVDVIHEDNLADEEAQKLLDHVDTRMRGQPFTLHRDTTEHTRNNAYRKAACYFFSEVRTSSAVPRGLVQPRPGDPRI